MSGTVCYQSVTNENSVHTWKDSILDKIFSLQNDHHAARQPQNIDISSMKIRKTRKSWIWHKFKQKNSSRLRRGEVWKPPVLIYLDMFWHMFDRWTAFSFENYMIRFITWATWLIFTANFFFGRRKKSLSLSVIVWQVEMVAKYEMSHPLAVLDI